MKSLGFKHRALGVAVLPVKNALAKDAFVCRPCVEDLVTGTVTEVRWASMTSAVFGTVMAHEVAHLLGINHSLFGVMHERWSRDELVMAEQGRLLFQPQEARTIKSRLRTRMRVPYLSGAANSPVSPR